MSKSLWHPATLAELGHWSGGQTPLKSNPAFWDNGTVPWISPKDVRGTCISNSEDKITDLALECTRLNRYSLDSIMVVVRSGILRRYFPVCRCATEYTVNQDLKVLEPSDDINPSFAFHLLAHLSPVVLRKAVKAGTTVESVDMPTFLRLPFDLPPLPQQRKIARILTTVDRLIEKTESLIEKYKSIKQGMMHDLFTRGVDSHCQLRPPYEEAPQLYKQSPLGWIPKEWQLEKLAPCIGFITDYRGMTPPYTNEGIPVISAESIAAGTLKPTKKYVTPETYKKWTTRGFPEPEDVIFTTEAPVGAIAALPQGKTYLLTRRVIALRPKQDVLTKRFLYWLLLLEGERNTWLRYQHGSTVPRILKPDLLSHEFPLPNVFEQNRISERLDACKRTIAMHEMELKNLRKTKTGLMQDLLTGKVRVNIDDTEEALSNA